MLLSKPNLTRLYGLTVVGLLLIGVFIHIVDGQGNWWNINFAYRIKITFDNSQISENLVNFPMPIVFSSSQSSFWSHVQTNGNDIRFVDADDSTELYYELEQFNHTSDSMVAWVKVPQIDSASTTDYIWLYYGNNGTNFDSYYNSSNVWASDYKCVYHFNQTSGTLYDATSNNNDGAQSGGVTYGVSGKVDGSLSFDGSDDIVNAADSASLNITGSLTIEAWMYYNSVSTGVFVAKGALTPSGASQNYLFATGVGGTKLRLRIGSTNFDSSVTHGYGTGTWHHVVCTYSDSEDVIKFYSDGNQLGTDISCSLSLPLNDQQLHVGQGEAAGIDKFNGRLDEIRISNVVGSSKWVKACYQYQVDQSKLTIGNEETQRVAKIYVNPSVIEKGPGDVCHTFQVNVTIENVSDLWAFDFNLTWDNGLITLATIDYNTPLDNMWGSGNWFLAFNKTGAGYYELAAVSTSTGFTRTEPTPLATLEFHVENAPSGETLIHFAMVKLSNSESKPIPTDKTDGIYRMVRPAAPPTILYIDPSLVEKTHQDVGGYFNVSIMIQNVTDLFGFDFNITWDNVLITYHNCYYNDALDAIWGAGNWQLMKNENGVGWHKFVAVSTKDSFNTAVSQLLFTLEFRVEDPHTNFVKETYLHFETHKLSDSHWTPITHTTEDGIYRITGPKPALQMNPALVTCRKYGEHCAVTVNVSNAFNLADLEFEIHYNTTLLDYVGVTWDAWGSGTIILDEVNGIITGSTSGSPKSGTTTLMTTEFNATYHYIWKNLTCWTNNLTGVIFFQAANLSYLSGLGLRYERGGLNEINVGPDIAYTFSPIQGDVDNNGVVDVFDLRTVAYYYDTVNPDYNLIGDDIVDIFDLVIIGANFGYTYDC